MFPINKQLSIIDSFLDWEGYHWVSLIARCSKPVLHTSNVLFSLLVNSFEKIIKVRVQYLLVLFINIFA